MLNHKLLHDLLTHRAQFLAIALVIAIGVAAQVSTGRLLVSLTRARDDFYAQRRFADVFATLKRAPAPVAARLASVPGVHVATARVRAWGTLPDPRLDEPGTVLLVSWVSAVIKARPQRNIAQGADGAVGPSLRAAL